MNTQNMSIPTPPAPGTPPEDLMPTQLSPGMENPGTPWVDVASHLIWLGAEVVESWHPRPGVDVNQALRHLAGFCQDANIPYVQREAATAELISKWFHAITLDDGTVAGALPA